MFHYVRPRVFIRFVLESVVVPENASGETRKEKIVRVHSEWSVKRYILDHPLREITFPLGANTREVAFFRGEVVRCPLPPIVTIEGHC